MKKSKIPDKLIPIILGITSIFLCAIWTFATSDVVCFKDVSLAIFISITQGVLLAGASVYVNQLYVQSKKE